MLQPVMPPDLAPAMRVRRTQTLDCGKVKEKGVRFADPFGFIPGSGRAAARAGMRRQTTLMVVVAPLVLTEAIPASREAAEAYI